ncbi:MAG: YggS family pyridoxal phosphate-dependent enzyme [Bacteroidales bacterium]|nr:YggS family pyridoxal phosphate-dependent enzyme [Bacteroidales bacterium]
MEIVENLNTIKSSLKEGVKLVAVSKTKPAEDILLLYNNGHKVFGENKVQELVDKYEKLPKDIEWHMIGHLQSNKVKYIASFVELIHGVDSYKLLKIIDKEAKKYKRIVKCLLQIHIAEEETKFGFDMQEIDQMLADREFINLNSVKICGLMGMATFTDNYDVVRHEFKNLKKYFTQLKNNYFYNFDSFKELSMGMSDDYPIAIEEGSTIVRIGSSIFGSRNYN